MAHTGPQLSIAAYRNLQVVELFLKSGASPAAMHDWAADVPLLATVNEAARELRVNRRTVYKLIAVGKLEAVKIGPRTTRITGASILRLAGVKVEN